MKKIIAMGTNTITNVKKCGDILINIKTMKNKTKSYIFHCAFCSIDCDQLKKFSKHLEHHMLVFEENFENIEAPKVPTVLYEAEEIKVEVDEIVTGDNKSVLNTNKCLDDFVDPLDPIKSEDNNTNNILSNNEPEDERQGENINKFKYNSADDKKDADYCHSTDEEYEEYNKNIEESFTVKESTSEDSDDSRVSNFGIESEINSSKSLGYDTRKENAKFQSRKRISKKKMTDTNHNESNITNKLKRRRRPLFENILPLLIQQYKKHEILWQVDNIAFGVINKKYEVYGKIAEEIKLDHDETMSLEDVNYHINYLNQLYSKDKEHEIKCNLEKKTFIPEYEHYKEMSFLSDSQGPYLCPICNELLPRYDPYRQHMAQHNGNPPFKCPTCSLTFNKYHRYLIHKKRHLGILNFHCDVCGKGYLFKNDLEWHVTSHTGDKPFLCPICGRGFRARHGYDNHIRRHEERFRYECHICKRGFNFLYALNTHIKSHLNIRDVICKICGKGFTDSKYLRRHELIHGEVKRYKCNVCGKAFFQACGLRAHRKNHHS